MISSLLALVGLAAASAQAFADYRSVVLADSPDSYFRMHDSGTTMLNEVGSTPDGTHLNNPTLGVPGALLNDNPNLAVYYAPGSDQDRSRFTANGSYSQFSLEFFLATTQTVAPSVVNWYDGFGLVDGEISGSNNDAGTALVGDGKVGFGLGNPDETIASTTEVNDGDIHHVVATSNGSGVMKLYIDGVLEAQDNTGPTGSRSNSGFAIGSLNTDIIEFDGVIDEVAFYKSELTATDVSQHYAARFDGPPPPPPGRLTVFPSGGGRGDLTGPGISCTDIGAFLSGGGDCQEEYAPGTQVSLTPHPYPGSRFSLFVNYFQPACNGQTTCSYVAQSDVNHYIGAVFHLRSEPLGNAILPSLAGSAQHLVDAYGVSVDPGKKDSIKTPNASLQRPDLELADGGGVVGFSVPTEQASLIGSDGATLIGSDGATLSTRSPNPASLIGSDGATLIGSDGGTLIGSDGATLVGNAGNTLIGNGGNLRPAHDDQSSRPAERAPKQTYKVYALGHYLMTDLDSDGNVQVDFVLTKKGRQIIKTLGQMNRALKDKQEEPLKVTFLEVVQPKDDRGSGGAYQKFTIK